MAHYFYQQAKRFGPNRVFFSCSVLYSCATEEGPFGAETFCLLVKIVCHMFNAQSTLPNEYPDVVMNLYSNSPILNNQHGVGKAYCVVWFVKLPKKVEDIPE